MSRLEYSDAGEVDVLIINLRREADARLAVMSVELVNADMRNRYSFKNSKRLEDVFLASLAERLRMCLSQIKPNENRLGLPDFEYSRPGLILSGLQIHVTVAEDGTERIMLRIRNSIGTIKSVFRFDQTMAVSAATTREKIAVDVLQDIISPLFDLMALDAPEMDDVIERHAPAIRKRLAQLSMKQEEIIFFTGLLQRYVAGCKQDALEAGGQANTLAAPTDVEDREVAS